jgi:quercetin dioxygenase-like cupin family protein
MKKTLASVLAALAIGCGSSQSDPAMPEPVEPAAPVEEPAPAEPTTAAPAEPAPPAEPARQEPGDPLEVGPDIYKELFANESVRVLEVTFAPGAKIAMHKHPDHVAYAVTGGKLKIAPAEGEAQEMEIQPGMALFMPAQAHAAENTGTTELKLAVVELNKKGTAAPEGKDPVVAGKKIYKLVLDDPHVRVLEVSFKKGGKIAAHAHPDHAIYVLEGGKLSVTGADGTAQELELQAGQATFLPAAVHSAKNTGKTPVKAVVFEIKP